MITDVIDAGGPDERPDRLRTLERLGRRLRPDGKGQAVQRDGGHPGEPSEATWAVSCRYHSAMCSHISIPDSPSNRMGISAGRNAHPSDGDDRAEPGSRRVCSAEAEASRGPLHGPAASTWASGTRVLRLGGLAVQESRHLCQPGWIEAGNESCGAGSAEAVVANPAGSRDHAANASWSVRS